MTRGDAGTQTLRREIEAQRQYISRDLEAIGDRVSPGRMADRSRERTRRRLMTWRDRVMGSIDGARERVGDVLPSGAASGSVHDGSGPSVEGVTERVNETVNEKVEGSPLVAGMVAFGLGFIAGSVVPASRGERKVAARVQPQVEQLAQEAAGTVREAGEHLAPVVREEATGVKEDAAAAASSVADAVKQEASGARDDASMAR